MAVGTLPRAGPFQPEGRLAVDAPGRRQAEQGQVFGLDPAAGGGFGPGGRERGLLGLRGREEVEFLFQLLDQLDQLRLAAVHQEDLGARGQGRSLDVAGKGDVHAPALGHAAADGQGAVAGLVLVAHADQVAGVERLARLEIEFFAVAFDLAHHAPGAGLLSGLDGLEGALRQEDGVGGGPPEGLVQEVHGRLFGLGVVRVVAQHLVGAHGVVNVVRAFLAALDLPGRHLGHGQERLGQHVQGEVRAGEEPFGVLLALAVETAAGLHATAAQPGLAAQVAGPVAPPGHAVAERAVHEDFQVQVFGAGVGHHLDFVQVQLTGQDHAVCAELGRDLQPGGVGDIGKGGEVDLAAEPGLAGQFDHGQVLDDDRLGLDGFLQPVDEPSGGFHVSGLDQGVHGDVGLGAPVAAQACQPGKLADREVGGLHAGREMLQPHVDGVRTGGHCGEVGRLVPGGGHDFRNVFVTHKVLLCPCGIAVM